MRAQPDASAVNSQGIAPLTQTSGPLPNIVTMSSVLNSSFTADAAKLGKEKPSRAGLIPLAAEVNDTLRISGAFGSTGVELPPEQAATTNATVTNTAINRCLNHIEFTLLHILSNYGSEMPKQRVSTAFLLENHPSGCERATEQMCRFLPCHRLPIGL